MPQITLGPAEALGIAAAHANLSSDLDGYTYRPNRFFRFQACRPLDVGAGLQGVEYGAAAIPPPPIDWRLWNGTDDVATFLNTQDQSGGWTDSGDDPTFGGHATRAGRPDHTGLGTWICDVATWMLPYVSGRAYSRSLLQTTPPIWPGVDYVTVGTPVALAQGVTVEGPMHGLTLAIDTPPPDVEKTAFDSIDSYYHIGQLAFENDDGAIEGFQPFSFLKEQKTPRRMVIAERCYIRCFLGITGSATPWTITALAP
jgi:hypothetical protein